VLFRFVLDDGDNNDNDMIIVVEGGEALFVSQQMILAESDSIDRIFLLLLLFRFAIRPLRTNNVCTFTQTSLVQDDDEIFLD
jgi:hypothetical protein